MSPEPGDGWPYLMRNRNQAGRSLHLRWPVAHETLVKEMTPLALLTDVAHLLQHLFGFQFDAAAPQLHVEVV